MVSQGAIYSNDYKDLLMKVEKPTTYRILMALGLAAVSLVTGCGGEDLADDISQLKNCEVINDLNRRRCEKKEIKDGISAGTEQLYFQSRDVIKIGFEKQIVRSGSVFTLKNITSEFVFYDRDPVPAEGSELDAYGLYSDSPIKVKLFPLAYERRAFVYDLSDPNELGVWVYKNQHAENFKYSKKLVFVWDFPFAAPAKLSEPSLQVAEGAKRLELWQSELSQPVMADQDHRVIIGTYDMVNPR